MARARFISSRATWSTRFGVISVERWRSTRSSSSWMASSRSTPRFARANVSSISRPRRCSSKACGAWTKGSLRRIADPGHESPGPLVDWTVQRRALHGSKGREPRVRGDDGARAVEVIAANRHDETRRGRKKRASVLERRNLGNLHVTTHGGEGRRLAFRPETDDVLWPRPRAARERNRVRPSSRLRAFLGVQAPTGYASSHRPELTMNRFGDSRRLCEGPFDHHEPRAETSPLVECRDVDGDARRDRIGFYGSSEKDDTEPCSVAANFGPRAGFGAHGGNRGVSPVDVESVGVERRDSALVDDLDAAPLELADQSACQPRISRGRAHRHLWRRRDGESERAQGGDEYIGRKNDVHVRRFGNPGDQSRELGVGRASLQVAEAELDAFGRERRRLSDGRGEAVAALVHAVRSGQQSSNARQAPLSRVAHGTFSVSERISSSAMEQPRGGAPGVGPSSSNPPATRRTMSCVTIANALSTLARSSMRAIPTVPNGTAASVSGSTGTTRAQGGSA